MCECDDFESPAFLRKGMVKGRKEHRCYECGKTIPVGTVHESVTGMWEGEVYTMRTCPDCLKLREMVYAAGCHCTVYGWLHQSAKEHDVYEAWERWKRERDEFAAHPTLPELAGV